MVKVIYKVVRHFYRRIFHHFANFFHYQRGQRVALSFLAALSLSPTTTPKAAAISPASQKWRKTKVEEHIIRTSAPLIISVCPSYGLWLITDICKNGF